MAFLNSIAVQNKKKIHRKKSVRHGEFVNDRMISIFFYSFRLLIILEDKNYKLKMPKNYLLIYQAGKSPID